MNTEPARNLTPAYVSELSPYDLGITDDPEVPWADIQPGEREFCAQAAASYPEHERQTGEAAAARMAELERQAAALGLDIFGDPLPNAYVTEISVPTFDDGTQQLHSHMKEPEDEPEAQA